MGHALCLSGAKGRHHQEVTDGLHMALGAKIRKSPLLAAALQALPLVCCVAAYPNSPYRAVFGLAWLTWGVGYLYLGKFGQFAAAWAAGTGLMTLTFIVFMTWRMPCGFYATWPNCGPSPWLGFLNIVLAVSVPLLLGFFVFDAWRAALSVDAGAQAKR
jgi:hypothetical protein